MDLEKIYTGKCKTLFLIKNRPNYVLMRFDDIVTAGDGAVRMEVPGKGRLCAKTSAFLMKLLEEQGVRTHLVEYSGGSEMIVKKLRIIPVEVIVRNYAYGSQLRRMPLLRKLQRFEPPIVEYHYKSDELHDPLILREDILHSGLVSTDHLRILEETSLSINKILVDYFNKIGLRLIDMKLEFGFDENGEIILGDEITGDTIRVIDESGNHLDKEIFRQTRDPKLLIERYTELARRLGVEGK